jgi:arylsulfatase A-like enzyme
MKYLDFKATFCFLLISCLALAQSPKPNVVIIYIDDMGYGDLSCYGNTQFKTSNIDWLATQGTRLTSFYVNSPVCSPSRVAMLTGQYPARHHFYTYLDSRAKNRENHMPDYLPGTVATLAKMMKANGYATAHIGKWHLGGGRDVDDAPLPTAYGFDQSFTSFEGLGDRTLHLDDTLNKASAKLGQGKIVEAKQNQQTAIYVDSALAFIKRSGSTPFFLHLFPNDVHDPYNPVEGSERDFEKVTDNKEQQKFLATLKNLDLQIGRFISQLKTMGKLNNTLILLTSDNGPTDWPYYYKNGGTPPCSAGDFRGRKWSLYEGGIREPFIAFWPGHVPKGRVDTTTIMSVVDILPTVCQLTGAKLTAGYRPDGYDRSRNLLGNAVKSTNDMFWYYSNKPLPGKKENISPVLAVRSGDWKFLMEEDGSNQQLYNIKTDHREQNNLLQQEKNTASALYEKLKSWYQEVASAR